MLLQLAAWESDMWGLTLRLTSQMTRLHWSLSHPRINNISHGLMLSGLVNGWRSSCDMYIQRSTKQKSDTTTKGKKAKSWQLAGTSAPGILPCINYYICYQSGQRSTYSRYFVRAMGWISPPLSRFGNKVSQLYTDSVWVKWRLF